MARSLLNFCVGAAKNKPGSYDKCDIPNPQSCLPMINLRSLGMIQVMALVVLLAGCQKKAADEVDTGSWQNTVYRNKFFGLTVTFPTNWYPQDQSANNRLIRAGENIVAGDDKNMQAEFKAGEKQSVNLFAAFKYPLGKPVAFNPSIISVAERVADFPGIQRGQDYIFHVKQGLQGSQLSVKFSDDISSARIAGKDFDVMGIELNVNGTRVKEEYYATIMKGYALSFILPYTTDEDHQTQKSILNSMTLGQ